MLSMPAFLIFLTAVLLPSAHEEPFQLPYHSFAMLRITYFSFPCKTSLFSIQ